MSEVVTKDEELPDGWILAELGNICTVDNGRGFKKTEWVSEGLPINRIQNLKNSGAKFNYFNGELGEQHRVKTGDLLFAWSGTPGTSFGAHIWHGPDAALNQYIFNVRFDSEEIEPKYFYYALNQNVTRYVEQAQGGVGLAHITKGKFMSSTIPLMAIEQQKRIVAKIEELFSHIDAGIEALKKAKQLLKQYRQSVLKAAVTGELTKEWRAAQESASVAGGRKPGAATKEQTAQELLARILKERRQKWEEQQLEQFKAKGKIPKDDKWKEKYKEPEENNAFESNYPDDWLVITLDRILEEPLINGLSVKGSDNPPGIAALKLNAISDGILAFSHRRYLPVEESDVNKLFIKEGDIFISRGNGSLHLVGRAAIAKNVSIDAIFPDTMIRVRIPDHYYKHGLFLFYWDSRHIRTQIESSVKTTAGIWKISQAQLKSITLPLPSIEEQKEIYRITTEKLSTVNRLESEVDVQLLKAERNKHSVLASAFSGELEG